MESRHRVLDTRRAFEFLKHIRILPKELKEAELFVFGLTFLLLLLVINSGLLTDLISVIQWDMESESRKKGASMFYVPMLIIGAFMAIYVAFTQRPLNSFVTYAFKFYFPCVNAALAVAIGIHTLDNPTTGNYILATWQFLQAAAFIFFTGQNDPGDLYDLPKRHARRNEILLATVVVVSGVILGTYYGWYWPVTFSGILLGWRFANSLILALLGRGDLLIDSAILGRR